MLQIFEKKIGATIKKYQSKFKKMTNIDKMMKKISVDVMNKIQSMTSMKPQSKEDYIKVGRLFIAKKILIVSLLLILGFLYIFNRIIYPWAEGRFWTPELTINTDRFYVYSGKAKVLDTHQNLLYVGELSNGRINGNGSLYNPSGQLVYRGEFANEQYTGYGERYDEYGSLFYQGSFDKNLYHGEGKLYDEGVLLYEGLFQNGEFQGQGQLFHYNGNPRFIGNFQAGLLNGEAKEYNLEGALIYNGFFLDGLYEGLGAIYHPETKSIIYEGNFRKGKYEGMGRLYDQNNGRLVYEGEFSEGLYHGEGKLYNWKGRDVYAGHFFKGEIDYYRYIDAPIDLVRQEFGQENSVQFFLHQFALDYHDLSMLFSFENPQDDKPFVHKIVFLGGQDFLGGPIGMPISKLVEYNGENESDFYYIIDEEKQLILERLRISPLIDSLYSVKYIIHNDIFVRYYALNPQSEILYFEIGGL